MTLQTESRKEPAVLASIIILTKNGDCYLRSLLDGLANQSLAGHAEVILIDSGSQDDTLRIVSEYPEVRLHEIPPEEFGHGKTRNLGARLARGEFLVYIPQDATPVGRDWLEKLLRPFADSNVAGVYSRQVPRPEANVMEKFFLGETYSSRPEVRSLAQGVEASLARCFFSTVSGAVRASVWRSHPFRDEVIMSEDQAWAADVMQSGFAIVYEPDSKVLHSHQYGIADVFRRNFDSGYSIKQIFAGKTGISFQHVISRLAREAKFVLRQGSIGDWLSFIPYEAARHVGFVLGVHAEKLPVSMRRRFSSLRYFWGRPSQMKN